VLTYAVLTPARDEETNLPRLASALAAQTREPLRWVVVDNGSVDGTRRVIDEAARTHAWIRLHETPGEPTPTREAVIARALVAGIGALDVRPDVLVKVDADISFAPDYFEILLDRFERDPALAIASGSAFELEDGHWRQRFSTGTTVWGAARAWRSSCLEQMLPLDERVGWDGIDVVKANLRGWRTATFLDLPFYHHRREGERDGTLKAFVAEGSLAHYLSYRPSYLAARALFQATRRPAAVGMVWGYAADRLARRPRYDDAEVTAYLRGQQRLRHLARRAREAKGVGAPAAQAPGA
jgi:biofilm PGA synthesis N-glycosyltransferase PgaC